MAARLSKEERLQRLVEDCREKVGPRDAAAPISLSQTPKSHLKNLVKGAAYQRIAAQFLNLLDRRLKDAGIGTYPELLDPTITRRVIGFTASSVSHTNTPGREGNRR
jgi:hypothetical protein